MSQLGLINYNLKHNEAKAVKNCQLSK